VVDSKYLVGDKKASCPSCRVESIDQKTPEYKGKSKTQGERKTQKEQSKKMQREMQKQQSAKTMIERARVRRRIRRNDSAI